MAVIIPAGKQGEYAIESGLIQKTVCSLFRPAVQRVVFQNPAVVFRVHFGTQFPERFFTRGTAPGQLGIQDHGGVIQVCHIPAQFADGKEFQFVSGGKQMFVNGTAGALAVAEAFCIFL